MRLPRIPYTPPIPPRLAQQLYDEALAGPRTLAAVRAGWVDARRGR